jgi:hypothetical protein
MDSLTELYNEQILPLDEEIEKQASEMWKQAEEEDAAGRIMARGFADEMDKLAGFGDTIKSMGKGETIKSKGYAAANANTGKHNISGGKDNLAPSLGKRTSGGAVEKRAPAATQVARNAIGANKGGKAISMGKQFKNMQAGGNSAPGAKPAVAAKPAAAKPVAALGSVTGKMNFGAKMPSLPGAGKAKPAVAAKPAAAPAAKPVAAGGPAGRLRNQGAKLAPMKPYS